MDKKKFIIPLIFFIVFIIIVFITYKTYIRKRHSGYIEKTVVYNYNGKVISKSVKKQEESNAINGVVIIILSAIVLASIYLLFFNKSSSYYTSSSSFSFEPSINLEPLSDNLISDKEHITHLGSIIR